MESTKKELFQAIAGTDNGKTATTQQQELVLQLVRTLEREQPSPENLLETNLLDGAWYLQWTSPSQISQDTQTKDDGWKVENAEEKITTKPFQAKGSVSAAGINVDTSNKLVQQSIDCQKRRVSNDIELEWGQVHVEGSFRPSNKVATRAVVAFDAADITLKQADKSLTLRLGFLFGLIAILKGTKENGWLETTFIDKDMRIGRGNKGTCFVLTRDPKAIDP